MRILLLQNKKTALLVVAGGICGPMTATRANGSVMNAFHITPQAKRTASSAAGAARLRASLLPMKRRSLNISSSVKKSHVLLLLIMALLFSSF
jgi:hypothetical protein